MEQAKKNLEDIHKSRDSEAALMKVQPREKSNFSGSCCRCGGGHLSDSCRFCESDCDDIALNMGISLRNVAKNRQT